MNGVEREPDFTWKDQVLLQKVLEMKSNIA